SGYVAKHGQDFLMANDPWFRGLIVQAAHDGGVYVADWCDTGECHNYKEVNPRGRIYKITYGEPKRVKVDLAKLSDKELPELQAHKNDWYVRHARRLLQERYGSIDDKVRWQLRKMIKEAPDVRQKLRALWALHGFMDFSAVLEALEDKDDVMRA